MRVWLIALLALVTALAGCTGGDGDADVDDVDDNPGDDLADQDDTTDDTNGTGDAPNTPPTATLSASIEQGAIPFNVTFDMDGADADGDELSWTLDADGDGTPETEGSALPANFTHTYDAEGLYNVSLVVSDGLNETAADLVINATAAAAGEGPVFQVDASWVGGHSACQIWFNDLQGIEWTRIDLPAETKGRPFVFDYTTTAPGVHTRVSFWNDEASVATFDEDATDLGGNISDTVPADATYVRIGTCGPSGPSSGTLVVS